MFHKGLGFFQFLADLKQQTVFPFSEDFFFTELTKDDLKLKLNSVITCVAPNTN